MQILFTGQLAGQLESWRVANVEELLATLKHVARSIYTRFPGLVHGSTFRGDRAEMIVLFGVVAGPTTDFEVELAFGRNRMEIYRVVALTKATAQARSK